MAAMRVISTSTIQAPIHTNTTHLKIHLTPWDLESLPLEMNQKGLLFNTNITRDTQTQIINHLKHSLSTTLSFFPPLAGRLITTHYEEEEDNTFSSYILCNNVGAIFVHAEAENTRVSDILQSKYVPPILRSFFPLNGVRNYQGTSQPLLAVQVTELIDGFFIGFTINHVVSDGESLWKFINSWSEISRSCDKPSKIPSLERFFLNGIEPPLRFPFTMDQNRIVGKSNTSTNTKQPPDPKVRIFNFTKEKIAKLKARANEEAETVEKLSSISSLQALLSRLWISVIRSQRIDPTDDVSSSMAIGLRQRMCPPLPENYFGNAVQIGTVRMRAEEVLEGGIGKVAMAMNMMVASHDDEKVRSHYESMARKPILLYPLGGVISRKALAIGSSPRFDVFGNDFGLGKPVAVRTGGSNKIEGMISVFCGVEEGSVDIEVCLPYEILEVMGNDPELF